MYDQATAAPPELEEVRCPQCGGLNRAGAEWCGQCLERFGPPKPLENRGGRAGGGPPPPPPPPPGSLQAQTIPSEPAAPSDGKAFLVGASGISWACKHCGAVNSIDTQDCSGCGMSFADMLRPPEAVKPERDPITVAKVSLIWPGAGHGYIGDWGQAIARGVMGSWMLVVAVVSFLQSGFGAMATIFGGMSFVFWAITAHDAFQEASKAPSKVILRGRYLPWLVGGILMLLMGLLVVQGLQANAKVR